LKVDILVLPFGINRRVYEVDLALEAAFVRNVHIFCSATLNFSEQTAYPANQQDLVISVNSTNANSRISNFNPPLPIIGDNFATLREIVRSSWPRTPFEHASGYTMLCSGTPVATVIAAAMVLDYARQNLPLEDKNVIRGLQSRHEVRNLLKLLGGRVGNIRGYTCGAFFVSGKEQKYATARMLHELEKIH
jgi:hypothetical protein